MTCAVPTCAEERAQLARLSGRTLDVTTHVCLPCGRIVCGIHSYARVTRFYGERGRQSIRLEPALCRECLDRFLPPQLEDLPEQGQA